jgi:haloalkane dehalogenase
VHCEQVYCLANGFKGRYRSVLRPKSGSPLFEATTAGLRWTTHYRWTELDMDIRASTEHRIPRDRGSLYVRDFPGSGAAFVLLHGFPDNSHIYDDLIPHLTSAGRRTISIDFLGYGASDKPEGAHYRFEQQLQDLEAVVEALRLEKIIPVGHDAGGPAAVNFALKHPERAAGVCLMNAFYGDAPGLRVPELIELFANKRLKSLAQYFLVSPEQFAWLLAFQRDPDRDTESPLQPVPWSDYRQQLQAAAKRGSCLRPNDLSILG